VSIIDWGRVVRELMKAMEKWRAVGYDVAVAAAYREALRAVG